MVVRIEEDISGAIMEKSKKRKEMSPSASPSSAASPTATGAAKKSGQVVILDGMSSSETTMIRRLAGNDPLIRKKTVRKLRKWLTAIAQRSPLDTTACREVIEPNTVRVWKALFYCMWMADKPLPQEQLAEHISDLVGLFASKPNALLVFVEWFFRTMAREWSWIDRLRLDKFMMLVRRFLRKTLAVLAEQKWKAETTDGLVRILKVHVFNHHPVIKVKKGEAQEPTVNCPVGFQIHIIDIFLEELAKVGGEEIRSSKVIKLLSPFINEIATNDDGRIQDEIRERVFHHLMRQSDVGMDYMEELAGGGVQEEMSDDEELKGSNEDANSDDEKELNGEDNNEEMPAEGEDEVFEVDNGPLDPRAGAVDVILPQLQIDYNILAEKLTEAGGQKIIKKKNRGLLYTLATQFRDIVGGKYPLALPEEESHKSAIPRKELKKATIRLVQDQESGGSKIRKTKKQRRREAKLKSKLSNDSGGSEDASVFLNDSELMDHVSDNYVSYVHEQMEHEGSSQESQDLDEEEDELEPEVSSPKAKKRRSEKKGKKYKTVIEVEADELDGGDDMMSMDPEELNINNNSFAMNEDDEEVVVIRRPKKSGKNKTRPSDPLHQVMKVTPMKAKHLTPTNSSSPKIVTPMSKLKLSGMVTPVNLNKLKGKGNTNTPGSGSGLKKRVSFVLARNLEHEATDYMGSISKSPAIPFDGNKTPNYGLLKINPSALSPMSSPQKKRALDFF